MFFRVLCARRYRPRSTKGGFVASILGVRVVANRSLHSRVITQNRARRLFGDK